MDLVHDEMETNKEDEIEELMKLKSNSNIIKLMRVPNIVEENKNCE